MSGAELKPCPFCGGRAELKRGEECAYVQCVEQKWHKGPISWGDNDCSSEAIAAWNTRTDTDAIAALVGALQEIQSGWTSAADPDTGELVEVAMSEDEMISIARTALARLGGGE